MIAIFIFCFTRNRKLIEKKVLSVFMDNNMDVSHMQAEKKFEEGLLYTLSEQSMVIVSSTKPITLLISNDKGNYWDEKTVNLNSGEILSCDATDSIFVDLNEDGTGCLVIGYGVSAGCQNSRCFLTKDNGDNWIEIPSVSDVHGFVITGAGYSNQGILSVAFRYYEDEGPDIWYTEDGGISWHQSLVISNQSFYRNGFRFTARNLSFEGIRGECDVEIFDADEQKSFGARLYSLDGGKEWSWLQ